ncbi:Gfo/Idh/MocA family protein [Erysipelothrix urinaevulpis]|uniref:Gfo/Idh/MocA family protein n=1 Tax=Erysipelothrix urinaevulpis TaxID=2683717 RepID=UPI0013572A82|nr:Gfo/Idh/MocA family oxidoreductase [Erysipelothrix urinaevulpis]
MRIGTIGTGVIVKAFIEAAQLVEGVAFVASYSRNISKAEEFVALYQMETAYDNYEAMLESDIDTVYIASPNSLHTTQALQAIDYGKNVIVEKPFAGTLKAAQEVYDKAIEKGVYVFEAICNIHMPHMLTIEDLLPELGPLKIVQANYSQYSSRYDQLKEGVITNVFDPNFSGGALADINIYNLHFITKLFGRPKTIDYKANQHDNGIDTSGILILDYDDFIVESVGAKDSFSYNFVQIQGENGTLHIPNGSNGLEKVIHMDKDGDTEYNIQDKPRLYYQMETFQTILNQKNYDIMVENLKHSLMVVELAEEARKTIGLNFIK